MIKNIDKIRGDILEKQKSLNISILGIDDIDEFLNIIEKYKLENSNQKKDMFDLKIHFDVIDGKFVNNVGVNLEFIKIVKRYGFFVDVHLMVSNPIEDGYIDKAIEYGADVITIHYEIERFEESLNYLLNKKYELLKNDGRNIIVGVSVKPETNIEVLETFYEYFDLLLVMSVEPGFGGQKYMNTTDIKLKNIPKVLQDKIIEVDGGINDKTFLKVYNKVDWFVIGKYFTGCINSDMLYNRLNKINRIGGRK